MQELKCPDCGGLNPDIRELGYTLPWTCGHCQHVWRLQDLGPIETPKTKAEALAFLMAVGIATKDGTLAPEYGGVPKPTKTPLQYRATPLFNRGGYWHVESELGHPVCDVADEATARLFADALNKREQEFTC